MELTKRQSELFEFVKGYHGDQLRKYTDLPYWTHLLSVADIVNQYVNDECVTEIALCHDLYEDTKCRWDLLFDALVSLGYTEGQSNVIADGVSYLSDTFTKERHPNLNRQRRKTLEAGRLATIPSICQSIKYADLIDNSSSIVAYDEGFAKVYLKEKRDILRLMKNGDPDLYIDCCYVLKSAELKLSESLTPSQP